MARGSRGRLRGRKIAGGGWVRRLCTQIPDGRKIGGGNDTEEEGDAGSRKLVPRGGQIEQGGSCIGVRGRRIGRAGLRINSQGQVYVPDSEEEEANMEMEDGAPGAEVAADGAPAMELTPEVQARLEAVLAGIDPLYHDVFVSFYKVMVPAFFKAD